MVGEDPEGEAAVLDDRLSAAARIADPVDRIAGECAIQGCGKHRGRRWRGEGRLVGDRWRDGDSGGVGTRRRWKEEEAVEEARRRARKGRGVVGMHERSSSNPRRMQQERCRRSIQSPPFRPTFIHRHSCYSPMRKKESVFREIPPLENLQPEIRLVAMIGREKEKERISRGVKRSNNR